ncbi:MAG: hypothetical protein AAF478_08415 [Pseudomonadota bacterium]
MAISCEIIDQQRLEPAFELVTQVFVQSSTLHQAMAVDLDKYRQYLYPSFLAMIGERLSIAAMDDQTNEILGCLIVTELGAPQEIVQGTPEYLKPIAALTAELCLRYRQRRPYVGGEVVLVDMGAVSPSAGGKGVYQTLRNVAQETARDRGFRYVVGELSSAATQHVIINKLGHRKMAEVSFNEFDYEGRRPFQSISEPRSIILAEFEL